MNDEEIYTKAELLDSIAAARGDIVLKDQHLEQLKRANASLRERLQAVLS